jgi:hypothetical protein
MCNTRAFRTDSNLSARLGDATNPSQNPIEAKNLAHDLHLHVHDEANHAISITGLSQMKKSCTFLTQLQK